ncbi:MAG: hypothetical protein JNG88_05780 [Phycisphaerales bacterium]|nr:hypothetical protein [Phycisphaerales bacterium]
MTKVKSRLTDVCSMARSCHPRQSIAVIVAVFGVSGFAAITRAQEKPAPPSHPGVHHFAPADARFLDEVQKGCFNYFWNEVGTPAMLAKDRKLGPVASIAAVGFQLSSLPIGVERGWITREQGADRAATVLRALLGRDDNKKWGMYMHFPDMNTAGPSSHGYECEASTVDTALLIAGAIPAGEYFGGDVAKLVDRLVSEADWKRYAVAENGFITMAWKPTNKKTLDGPGDFMKHHWWVASDEERIVYFLAVGTPNADHAVPPALYYKLKRQLASDAPGALGPFAMSWNGSLFTYLFSHCWIDYASLGKDDPARLGSDAPPINWFESSRAAVLAHRARCIALTECESSLGDNAWGLSACDGQEGYIVPSLRPSFENADRTFGCTIAPYAAGTALMLTPVESLAALRAFRDLNDSAGKSLVWNSPDSGGYGFADAFKLGGESPWISKDNIGIDAGPMLLGIENARTGLIWRLFMKSETARRAVQRLRLSN